MFCKYLAHMDCTATTLARYCNYHTLFFIVKKTSAKVVIYFYSTKLFGIFLQKKCIIYTLW